MKMNGFRLLMFLRAVYGLSVAAFMSFQLFSCKDKRQLSSTIEGGERDTSGDAGGGGSGGGDAGSQVACTFDGSWTTLVERLNWTDSYSPNGQDIAADANGNIFVVGDELLGSYYEWRVDKSTSPYGSTFDYVSFTAPLSGTYNSANGIAIDSANNLYTVGYAATAGGQYKWLVRKSVDGGTNWTNVDNYEHSSGRSAFAWDIAIVGANIYVAGYADDGTTYRWIVRKSADAGATWTTVDDFQLTATRTSMAYGLAGDSSGRIYVVGTAADGASLQADTHWIVRRSADAGATWSTVDDYQMDAASVAGAYDFGQDNAGNLFVVGYAHQGASWSTQHFVVRKSTTGDSGSWSNTNTGISGDGTIAGFHKVNARAAQSSLVGNEFYVAGYRLLPGHTSSQWIVLKTSDGGANWTVDDAYQYSPYDNSASFGLGMDAQGSLYTTGFGGQDVNGKHVWVVRRKKCNP